MQETAPAAESPVAIWLYRGAFLVVLLACLVLRSGWNQDYLLEMRSEVANIEGEMQRYITVGMANAVVQIRG